MKQQWITLILKILISMGVLVSTSGCSGTDTARWTEEVKSRDGTVFQLEGRAEIGSNGWPNAHRGNVRYIEYYHRPTKAYWRSPRTYNPYIFDLINGVPYVVIPVGHRAKCYLLNYPQKGILIYRWNAAAGWQAVNAADLPSGLEFNVLQQVFDTRDKRGDVQGFVSLDKKAYREGDRIGEFAKWLKEHENFCEKERSNPPIQTDDKPQNFIGFHGKPDF